MNIKKCLAFCCLLTLLLSSCTENGVSSSSPQQKEETIAPSTTQEEQQDSPAESITASFESESIPEMDALASLRQEAAQAESLCSFSYLGYQYDLYSPAFDIAPLLTSFPCTEQSVLVDATGEDVFAIVPTNENASVTVERLEMNDNGELVPSEILYEGDGTPFLLRCNVSDIFPNTLVTVTGTDGNTLSASPFISLRDGSAVMEGAYDFTKYPEGFVREE